MRASKDTEESARKIKAGLEQHREAHWGQSVGLMGVCVLGRRELSCRRGRSVPVEATMGGGRKEWEARPAHSVTRR